MSKPVRLDLHFCSFDRPTLESARFIAPYLEAPIVGVRGGFSSPRHVSFKWMTATHTLSLFFVKAHLMSLLGEEGKPVFVGRSKTPAAIIARFVNRTKSIWLLDLMGSDTKGCPLLLKTILCLNYHQRLPGPVEVYYRPAILPAQDIHVHVGDEEISHEVDKVSKLAGLLESQWRPGNNGDRQNKAA